MPLMTCASLKYGANAMNIIYVLTCEILQEKQAWSKKLPYLVDPALVVLQNLEKFWKIQFGGVTLMEIVEWC